MTNQMPNAPMMSGGSTSIFQTWINALTKPNEQTYSEIAASPSAKATTAYIWVLIEGAAIRARLSQSGLGTDQLGNGLVGVLISLICVAPILAIIQTALFAIVVAIIQWIAKMFGGIGTNDQTAYVFASISVPYSFVSCVFILLSAIPFVGFCFRIILGLAGLYILVLEIMGIKGVNKFGWGPAIGSVLIPGLVVGLLCCCLVAAFGAAMGSSIGNILSTLNQSQP
jgi:hypothetical protein